MKLKGPFLFSKNVKILTKNGILHGYATFIKICPDCKMCYRYQEYTDGVHNFDDRFFLSLDMCIFIRENVKQHVAVGTVCEILEQYLHIKLKQQTVLNAYLHFVALCAHNYDFNCLVCGFHPPVLIADLNRKVVFKCRNLDDQVADCDDSTADYVDCEGFWNKVEMNIVMKGFTSSIPSDLQVTPSIFNWSPYMGRFTRSNNLMVNTEHRKINKQSGEIEADCRELSEERLIEFMHKGKAVEIRQIARKAGVSDKGSKLDILNRVQRALHGDKAKFNKIFKKLWGCSGGWLTITCPHGIIYGVKFLLRSESPRDYIDMLRSMQHRPNVFVCDMAHMVAVQGNRYKEDFFSPFAGRVAEDTAENIEKAMSGNLTVSFPFLEDSTPAHQQLIDSDSHPVTGSNVRLALFDVFHQGNTNCNVESLRRIGCVKELKGFLNSQAAEQLHHSFNKNKHFLNQMTPLNHIFMFRSMIELRNETKNCKLHKNINMQASASVVLDQYGRGYLSIHHDQGIESEPEIEVSKRANTENSDSNSNSNSSVMLFSDMEVECTNNSISRLNSDSLAEHPEASPVKKRRQSSVNPYPYIFDYNNAKNTVWIEGLSLTNAEKHLIEDGYSLNAAIIDASSQLIRQENKELQGLLPIVPSGGYKGNGGLFVQILNCIGTVGNHWITVSNVFTEHGNVSIYDCSMRLNYKSSIKEIRYHVSIELDASNLRGLPDDHMTLYVEDTTQVTKNSDSGIAAIMFALAIARGRDPQTIHFNYRQIRRKLIQCFNEASFNCIRFDDSPRKKWRRKFEFLVPLYCHCNNPDMGDKMTCCSTCSKWYHASCEEGDFSHKDWKCKTCSNSVAIRMTSQGTNLDLKDVISTLSDSGDEHDSIGSSWNKLVNSLGKLYDSSCPRVDIERFTEFVHASLKKPWLRNMVDKSEVNFPSTPSIAGMENDDIKLICKYNATTYENAFQVINRVVIDKYLSRFLLRNRGVDKAMLIGAKIIQHYFEQARQSSESEEF